MDIISEYYTDSYRNNIKGIVLGAILALIYPKMDKKKTKTDKTIVLR
jgi:hypothetical protein